MRATKREPEEPLRAPGKWWHGRRLRDACLCGHDVGEHTESTQLCRQCACVGFRAVEPRLGDG